MALLLHRRLDRQVPDVHKLVSLSDDIRMEAVPVPEMTHVCAKNGKV
jgi:hypothetical protein